MFLKIYRFSEGVKQLGEELRAQDSPRCSRCGVFGVVLSAPQADANPSSDEWK